MKKINLLKSPTAVITGLVIGAVLGIFFKQTVPYIKPFGDIYLSMLQMCVLPIMISAIVISISRLLKSENGRSFIVKIIITLTGMLFLLSIVCVMISAVLPGIRNPSDEIKMAIGSMMSESSGHAVGFKHTSYFGITVQPEERASLADFFVNLVPKNIFTALSGSENLKIVFFFCIFGVLITMLEQRTTVSIRAGFEVIYSSFQKMIGLMMYLLPFGLCAMTASQFSEIGASMISSMLLLILLISGTSTLIFILSFIIICIKCGCSPAKQIKAMGQTFFVALGTKNSFAAIPSSISGLTEKLGLNPTRVSAVLPLGIAICRFGNVMIFTLASVFACGLYDVKLDFSVIVFIIMGSIFAGIASSGAPGIVARSMIAIVLEPLLIPSQSIIVILTMIDPMIDSFATLINVYPNCAVSAVVSKED